MSEEYERQFQLLAKKNRMSVNEVKETILPDDGEFIVINGFMFKVNVRNIGRMRFSAEFKGTYVPPKVAPIAPKKKGWFQK